VRKFLIVLAVLAVIALAVDRVAEHVAEGEVASVVMERESLPSEPNVEFHGFPFLTQVLANDLTKVTMTLPEVDPPVGDTEEIRVQDVTVSLYDVRTADNFHQATAQRMTGSAMIPFGSISALGPFTAEYAGQSSQGVGLIRLTPDVAQGLPIGIGLELGVAVAPDGGFTFVAADGTTNVSPVPTNLRPLIDGLVDAPHRLYGLPASFTVKSLNVTRDGIELVLAGTQVELTR